MERALSFFSACGLPGFTLISGPIDADSAGEGPSAGNPAPFAMNVKPCANSIRRLLASRAAPASTACGVSLPAESGDRSGSPLEILRPTTWKTAIRGIFGILWALLPLGCEAIQIPISLSGPTSAAGEDVNVPAENLNPNVIVFPEDADPKVAALPFLEDEFLARILPGSSEQELQEAYQQLDVTVVKAIPQIDTVVLRFDSQDLRPVATAVAQHPLIESVHKIYLYDIQVAPSDPDFSAQDHLFALDMPAAWEITTGSEEIVIAVLDSGVQSTHPDLMSKVIEGWNIWGDDADTSDVQGHGTAVAGTAAAESNNAVGGAGTSWKSPIMPVRITDARGRTSSRKVAAGIIWAVEHGARVVNVSFAPLAADRTVLAAAGFARNSGALVVMSSGNDGELFKARSSPHAVFVGAVQGSNRLASFSTTGPFVNLVAPGTKIYTTARGSRYREFSGTSFASPIVAGVAALIWAVNPDLRPTTVERILTDTAVDLGASGRDVEYGAGLIDPPAALERALEIVDDRDVTPPVVAISRPKDLQAVTGVFRVETIAFDDDGVADVVLSIDGIPFSTDTTKPFLFAVNSRKLPNGLHTLTVAATDPSGNTSRPRSVRISVGDSTGSSADGTPSDTIKPTVVINFPVEDATVTTSVGVRATVTDNVALARVEWLVDGVRRATERLSGTRQVVSFVWQAASAETGMHTITVRVTGSGGNKASATVRLVKR